MLGRSGGDLAGNAAQTLLNELLQTPAGAVAGQHRHIVDVEVAVAVGVGDLVVVDLAQPVVGGDGAGVGEDQTADGVGDGGVFLHAPVHDLKILVHDVLVVDHGLGDVAELFALAAVEDVGLGDVLVASAAQDGFHAVLDVLHGDLAVLDLLFEVRSDLQRQKVDGVVVILLFQGVKGLLDRCADLRNVEVNDLAVALDDTVHGKFSPFLCRSVYL